MASPQYMGVRKRREGRYTAEIRQASKKIRLSLGTFDTAEKAALAFDAAARSLRGPTAKTNFPSPTPPHSRPSEATRDEEGPVEVICATKETGPSRSLVVVSRVLKGIPQSPHFSQLRNLSELARNRLIYSWDFIFEELVEAMETSELEGFEARACEYWKTMGELQALGYNVVPLRRRLVELSDISVEVKLSKRRIEKMKIQAEMHRLEKKRIEDAISKMEELIEKEEEGMDFALFQLEETKKEFAEFDGVFSKLATEPL